MNAPTTGTGRMLAIATVVAVSCSGIARAQPLEFVVGPPEDADAIVFTSHAPLEDFEGRTDAAGGTLMADPDDLAAGLQLHVEVELATLDTGIGLRNRHMRQNHLHTDQHPLAVFEGGTLAEGSPVALPVGREVELGLSGSLQIHGISRERVLPLRVLRGADGSLRVVSEFSISLAAHDIPRPKFLVLKLADEQDVRVELVARPRAAGEIR